MAASATAPRERTVFLLAAGLAAIYVVARAFTVPIVHDEAMNFFSFVETDDYLPFRARYDAGNHVLLSALGALCYKVFGLHAWALRIPSVLAFGVYAAYAWKWGRLAQRTVVRWCLWAALLATPFVIDFFSLFRGYAVAMAMLLMAAYELHALHQRMNPRGLCITLAAFAMGAYASLNLLVIWAVALLLMAGLILRRQPAAGRRIKLVGLWLGIGLFPMVLIAGYGVKLGRGGALYYGLTNGVLQGTLPSLLKAVFGSAPMIATGTVALIVVAATVVPFLIWRKEPSFSRRSPWILLLVLLWADILSRYVLHMLNGTNYPEDRTAMQWIPLFILLAAFLVDHLAIRHPAARWAALLMLAFPLRTAATANLRTTSYWPEQAIPLQTMRMVEQLQQEADHPFTIGAYHQMLACWGFRTREQLLQLNGLDVAGFPNGGQDVLLIDPRRDRVPQGYERLRREPDGFLEVHRRSRVPAMRLVLDTLIHHGPSDAEFREVWVPPPSSLEGHEYRVVLDLALHTEQEPWTGDLVVEVRADTNYYENTLIQFLRDPQRSDSLHTTRRIPRITPATERVVVYLWNPERRMGALDGRMRVHMLPHTQEQPAE